MQPPSSDSSAPSVAPSLDGRGVHHRALGRPHPLEEALEVDTLGDAAQQGHRQVGVEVDQAGEREPAPTVDHLVALARLDRADCGDDAVLDHDRDVAQHRVLGVDGDDDREVAQDEPAHEALASVSSDRKTDRVWMSLVDEGEHLGRTRRQHLADLVHRDRLTRPHARRRVHDEADRGIPESCLGGEGHLGDTGHAGDRAAGECGEPDLGRRLEARSVEADVGAAVDDRLPDGGCGVEDLAAQHRVVGVRHVGVYDAAGPLAVVEGPLAATGEVEEVVDADDLARLEVGVDAAGDVDGEHVAHPEVSERPDDRAVVDPVRWHLVPGAVTGHEDDGLPVPGPSGHGHAPVCRVDPLVARVVERVEVVEAGARDDSQGVESHALTLPGVRGCDP